jgi:hypothetical protein
MKVDGTMTLNETQQKVLNIICSHGGGKKVREIETTTGLTYKQIIDISRQLIAKGYQIRAIGVGGWIERLFLSPYDKDYKTLIEQ